MDREGARDRWSRWASLGFWFLLKVDIGSRLETIIEHVCLCVKRVMSPLGEAMPPHPTPRKNCHIKNACIFDMALPRGEGEWGMLNGVSGVQGTHKGHPYGGGTGGEPSPPWSPSPLGPV